MNTINHDRLFKELISHFFIEFIDLFLPELGAYLDKGSSIVPLDKEVFTDITSWESHEVDLIMKVKVRGEEAFFLVHIENQASAQTDFPKRMFRYFSRLHEKYDLPIYPVVVFSYDTPKREAEDRYNIDFPGKSVLQFGYSVVQLNRLSWRDYVRSENPIASALMAKMQMEKWERPKVKVECLRLLATLKLNRAKTKLIGVFIDSYLRLTGEEMKQYEREFEQLAPNEREDTMEFLTDWERRGIEQGLQRGRMEGIDRVLSKLIRKRFNHAPTEVFSILSKLSADELDELSESILDFSELSELEKWLSQTVNKDH
jgi:hypothetical protein